MARFCFVPAHFARCGFFFHIFDDIAFNRKSHHPTLPLPSVTWSDLIIRSRPAFLGRAFSLAISCSNSWRQRTRCRDCISANSIRNFATRSRSRFHPLTFPLGGISTVGPRNTHAFPH